MTRSKRSLGIVALAASAALAGLAAPARAQTTERLSVGAGAVEGDGNSTTVSLSADGIFLAFGSAATNLVPGDGNAAEDIFVADRVSGAVTRVSVDPGGADGNGGSFTPSISADGQYVAFHSYASNLVAGDTNGTADIFVHDRHSGTTTRVSLDSLGAQVLGDCVFPSISADGRYVAFQSDSADLVPGDGNGQTDIFVRDLLGGMTFLVSQSTGGMQGDDRSLAPVISADGRFVAFDSPATNLVLGDTNASNDVFVRDLQSGTTERVSLDSAGAEGNAASFAGSLSADGRYVAFYGAASNLVPFDVNLLFDVFLRDRVAATTVRLSVTPVGRGGNGDSITPSISSNGRYVAFQSTASNLLPGDANAAPDIYVRDCVAGKTSRASLGIAGAEANSYSSGPSISANGRLVAFYSDASNLVLDDTNVLLDAFVLDREATGKDPSTPFCLGDGSAGTCPCANNGASSRGCANSSQPDGGFCRAAGSTAVDTVTGDDSIVLAVDGLPPGALIVVYQGTASIGPAGYGDGLRCTGGTLRRLLAMSAGVDGDALYPLAGNASVSERSANLGDPIAGSGATRYYQATYRDADPVFCPAPIGGGINITNGLSLVW